MNVAAVSQMILLRSKLPNFNISLDYLLGLIREPLPYERSDHAVQCPQDFTAEDIQKVREYIKFLEFQKKVKQ